VRQETPSRHTMRATTSTRRPVAATRETFVNIAPRGASIAHRARRGVGTPIRYWRTTRATVVVAPRTVRHVARHRIHPTTPYAEHPTVEDREAGHREVA
jgi:hypothetical protein